MAVNDPAPRRLLIADDQPDVIEALRLLLKSEGYLIDTAKSPNSVMKAVEQRDYALAIVDLNYTRDTTSGQEGLDLLARLQTADPTLIHLPRLGAPPFFHRPPPPPHVFANDGPRPRAGRCGAAAPR